MIVYHAYHLSIARTNPLGWSGKDDFPPSLFELWRVQQVFLCFALP